MAFTSDFLPRQLHAGARTPCLPCLGQPHALRVGEPPAGAERGGAGPAWEGRGPESADPLGLAGGGVLNLEAGQ